MTDPASHARAEKARLVRAFAALDKPRIKEALVGMRPVIGAELQRVVRTEGAAISESWPPLSTEWLARKTRLGKAASIGQFTGTLLRGLARVTPRLRSTKTKNQVSFQSSVKHARYFTRGRFESGRPRFIGLTKTAMDRGFDRIGDAIEKAILEASRV